MSLFFLRNYALTKKMWMRGWKRYCVCHLVLGIPRLLQVLMWFLKSADLFLIQSKLICPLLYLLVSRHINNPPPPPLLAERMVLRTPHSSTHPVLGMLAELGDCDVAALSGQHLLFWVTCQQRGRVSCTVRGLKEGWAGLRGRIPVSAGWSDWMRVTTTAVVFAKSFLKLTMWPVEGQTRQEIEVNDIVTY